MADDGWDTDDQEFDELASQAEIQYLSDCHPCPLNQRGCICQQSNDQCVDVVRGVECTHHITMSSESFVSPIMLLGPQSLTHHLREHSTSAYFVDFPEDKDLHYPIQFNSHEAMEQMSRDSFPLGLQLIIPKKTIQLCPKNRRSTQIVTILCSMYAFHQPTDPQKLGLLIVSLWLPRDDMMGDLLTIYLGTTIMQRDSDIVTLFLNVLSFTMTQINKLLNNLTTSHLATTLIFITNVSGIVNNMLTQIITARPNSFQTVSLELKDTSKFQLPLPAPFVEEASRLLDPTFQRDQFKRIFLDCINIQTYNPRGADPDRLYRINKTYSKLYLDIV